MKNAQIKILAIDANLDNLVIIQALILEFFINADVSMATSGLEGIDLAQSISPDIILLDIVLPDMDGYEVCRRLKANRKLKEVPVVFVTAFRGDKASRIRGLEVGAEAFLTKPIDESELIAQIRAMLKIKVLNSERRDENEKLASLVAERTLELNRTHIATMNLLEDLKNENEARKKTEVALRASEEKYRELANFLPQSVFELDAHKRISFVNEHTYLMLGYTHQDELIGRNTSDFHIPEELDRVHANFERLKAGIHIGGDEYQIVRKDGTTFPGLIYMNINWHEGECVGARGILVDISTQKNAEEKIRESEKKYRLITEKITDVVWLMDLTGKSLFVSSSIEKFTGYTVDEYLNQTIYERFTEESARRALEALSDEVKIFYNKEISTNDYRKTFVLEYKCKDGSIKYGELLITPYLNDLNQLIGFHGVTRDITKRTMAEKKLHESEEKFREMAEMLPQIVFETDTKGCLTYVNKQAYKLLGYDVEDHMLGVNTIEFYIEEDRARAVENIKGRINNEPIGNSIYSMVRKDGSIFPALVYSNPILRDEVPVGLRGIIVDISEQILAEKAIKESEALYRAIIEASPDYIIITDLVGNILKISPSTAKKFGYTVFDDIIGQNVANFIEHEDSNRMMTDFASILNGENLNSKEYKSRTADGSVFDIEVKGGVINDSEGMPAKLVFIARNITERKLIQEALEKSETKYRDFVEHSPEAIALYTDGVVTYVNQECLRLMRADTKDQLIGMPVIEFIHPDNREFVLQRMQRIGTTDMNTALPLAEEKYIRLDGTPIYVEVKVMPMMVDDKPSVQLTARDITERKVIQEALKESEDRYNTFINNNVDMIFVKDDQFRYLIANEAMAQFYGKSSAELIGKTDQEMAGNSSVYPCISSDKKALTASSAFVIEETLGEKVYETIKFPMQLKGNKKGVGGILRDITMRKHVEDALERSRTELKTIYDNAPVMMCLVDEERNVLFSNNAFSELIDDFQSDLKNDKIGNVIGCINAVESEHGCGTGANCKNCKLRAAINNTFVTGVEHRNIDYSYKMKRNNEITEYSLLGSTALIDNAGTQNLLLCLSDITDRRLTEEALKKSEIILRTFIDNIPFEIWARDMHNVGILENDLLVQHFGSIIGQKPEQQRNSKTGVNELYTENYKRVFEGQIVNEERDYIIDNKKKVFHHIIFPIFNKTVVNGIAGINIDITDRKQFEKALHESQVQIKKFAAHLQDVREEEKVLLAREIHDELGQILVALKIDMGMLKLNVLKSINEARLTSVTESFNDILTLIDNTIKTARKIMTNLRPEVLELLGFSDAIKFHAKSFEERLHVKCRYVNHIPDLALTNQQSVALFRIVQEALNNVAKHSMATEVNIEIKNVDDVFVLEITDNGIGFDVMDKSKQESYGLIGIKERVFLLEGDLTISSEKNKGTHIRIEMPFKLSDMN